ncbi:spo12 family domain-containing protein [Purpureocillium lavendulum]|uniref:Spo12 family domain-containing protein n=1 Tax=Purpureocillium lavendulum TaxID=1247861 RepID=A0AB34FFV0_9HYPO|nr:spo12 family domain-containing protein [Purpureocillium lavendulum]
MSSSPNKVLSDKDVNAAMADHQSHNQHQQQEYQPQQHQPQQHQQQQQGDGKDVKSMEYHRQVFQNKMTDDKSDKYVSPSDNIMSPCTAKINALRNKHAAKVKPKSLFAQASAKKLASDNPFGARPVKPE